MRKPLNPNDGYAAFIRQQVDIELQPIRICLLLISALNIVLLGVLLA